MKSYVKVLVFVLCVAFGCNNKEIIIINDNTGVLGRTNAPVSVELELSNSSYEAVKENRLALQEVTENINNPLIPLQLNDSNKVSGVHELIFIMPEGQKEDRKFKLVQTDTPFNSLNIEKNNGQFLFNEGDKKVLQYNYQTVYNKDVIYAEKEKEEVYVRNEKDTFTVTSIYAVPRSDYIHPLYGLNGEMLSRDWPSTDHPHHRGIFWAWPEVYYGDKLGDIYALQTVFARPTGNIEITDGPVYAEMTAENLWKWDDKEPIVNESACIRVYKASKEYRIIDLTIKILALKDSITIATRNTDSYGGLNIRMQYPEEQSISYYTDSIADKPQRAWSDFNGTFEGNKSKSGLTVLQHKNNPEYPGKWVEYPNLAWVQPTFPTPGTRYPLSKIKPLTLCYRLIVHAGGKPDEIISKARWDAFNSFSESTLNK